MLSNMGRTPRLVRGVDSIKCRPIKSRSSGEESAFHQPKSRSLAEPVLRSASDVGLGMTRLPLSFLPRGASDVLAIVLDQIADVLGGFRRIRTGVSHGAAEAHVIADVVLALRILEDVFDVDLPDAEVAVQVASVVWFTMVAH
jgi:hypothetical protein